MFPFEKNDNICQELALDKKKLEIFEKMACHSFQSSQTKYHFCLGSENLCHKKTESVWGAGPWYTNDSDFCLAAKHMGIINEKGGLFIVENGPGLKVYQGTLNNGVKTKDYGNFGSSVSFKKIV